MKKLLLATVAFAFLAPGLTSVAHADVKLDLGGFFKGYAGYADNDTPASRDFDFKRKAQIYFTGETTLDNGLTVGYNGQLVADTTAEPTAATGSDAEFEQSYLFFSGNWGRINLGKENGAAYLLQVTAPGADANLDGMDIDFSFFDQGLANVRQDYAQTGAITTDALGVRGEDFQYADKITYLTPKFNGFQAGVSYTPDVDAKDSTNYFGADSDATIGGYEHLIDAGIRYDGDFSGFGVHVGGGYTHASLEAISALNNSDYNEYNVGAKMTVSGFGFGGVYNHRQNNIIIGGDVDTWDLGADYTYGAYNFGLSYLNSQGDALGGGNDQLDRVMLGAGYTFGPGMKFNGSVGYDDLTADSIGADDNSAFVAAIGTDIQF